MVQFRPDKHEMIGKIVYYGPPLGGKTTNLRTLHQGYPADSRGELVVVPTGGDRTIFFDLLPIDAGKLRGMTLHIHLYTVPGQVHYNATRQIVLRGADGVVFVADSQRELLRANQQSWENLKENLLLQGLDLAEVPHVIQYNKRDLPGIMPVEELDSILNEFNAPFFESVATVGIGVEETLRAIVRLVMRSLRDRFNLPQGGAVTQPVAVPAPRRQEAAEQVAGPAGRPLEEAAGVTQRIVVPLSGVGSPAAQPEAVAAVPPAAPEEAPATHPEEAAGPFPEAPPPAEPVFPAPASPEPLPVSEVASFGDWPAPEEEPAVVPEPPPPVATVASAGDVEQAEVGSPAVELASGDESAVPFAVTPPEAPAAPFACAAPEPQEPAAAPPPAETPVVAVAASAAVAEAEPFVLDDQPFPDLPAPEPAGAADVFAIAPLPPQEPEPVERVVLGELQPRIMAALGNVRELELEIPVPARWIGGKRMTVQLRLTLVPQQESDDE